jgi:shikimate kinase
MGSGKTVVGRALAAQLDRPFIDLDERIEQAAGREIRDIFAQEGEDGFRRRERAALLALEPEFPRGAVIATGGGAFMDESTRAWMAARGHTVWLDASLETIENRVSRDGTRPLFGDRDTLSALYEERRRAYASARLRVPSDANVPDEIARTIARALTVTDTR